MWSVGNGNEEQTVDRVVETFFWGIITNMNKIYVVVHIRNSYAEEEMVIALLETYGMRLTQTWMKRLSNIFV